MSSSDSLASSNAKLKSLLDFLSEAESNVEKEATQVLSLGNTFRGAGPSSTTLRHSAAASSSAASSAASPSRTPEDSNHSSVATRGVPSLNRSSTEVGAQRETVNETAAQGVQRSDSVLQGVKSKIASLKQEVEVKAARISDLEVSLRRYEDEMKNKEARHATALKEQLLAQKNEFEDVIQRQLAFITKIVSDKEELTKRVTELTDQIDHLQKTAAQQLENQAASLTANFKRQRDAWAAAEKVRREAWIQERTQAIKEMTIRGLEPELQKIMDQSKGDLQRAQEQASEALRLQREEILAECSRDKELFKRQLMLEKDQAIDAERQRSAERLQEAVARGDDLLRESRARLLQEHSLEKQQAITSKDSELESLREELKAQHLRETQKVASALEEQRRRHDTFIAQLREQEKMERELWYSNMIKRLQREAAEKVEKIRTKLTEERDEELNLVIARLTRESSQSQQTAVAEYEDKLQEITRLRRMDAEAAASKEQRWESQLTEWKQKCTHLQNRWEQLQTRLNTSQLSLTEKDREMRQLVLQSHQVEDKLQQERQVHAVAIEQAKLEGARIRERELREKFEEDFKQQRSKDEAARAELAKSMENRKTQELEELHDRVQSMLKKKDQIITELRSSLLQQDKQIAELHTFIERQRVAVITELGNE